MSNITDYEGIPVYCDPMMDSEKVLIGRGGYGSINFLIVSSTISNKLVIEGRNKSIDKILNG